MVDNSVFITGVADNVIKDALEGIPPWATENTAVTVKGILEKSLSEHKKIFAQLLKTATAGSKGTDSKEAAKFQSELDKIITDFEKEDPKRKKRNKEEDEEFKKGKKRWNTTADIFGQRIALDFSLAAASKLIEQAFVDNVKTFDELTKAGINTVSGMGATKDGFQSLRELTAETGVRFTDLAKSMTQYSSAVNSFGIGKFAKTIGKATADLAQFGFSSKDAADLLGQQLTMQQNVGDVAHKSVTEQTEDLQKFAKNIFRLSIASGMDRNELMKHAIALSDSTEANLLSAQSGTAAAEGTTEFLASLKDQNVAKQMLSLMSSPVKQLNDTFMNLQKSGMGGFAQTFTKFQKDLEGMPPAVQQQAMKSFVESHRGELEQNKQRLALLKQAGVEGAAASLDFIVGLTKSADAITKVSDADMKRIEDTNKASKGLETAWLKFTSLLQRAFGPTSSMLNILTGVLTVFNVVIGTVIDVLDWAGSAIGSVFHAIFHPIETATNLMQSFVAGLQMLLHPIDTLNSAFTYLSEMFKGAIDMLMHPIDSLEAGFTKLGDTLSGGIDLTAWIGVGIIGIGLLKIFKDFGAGFASMAKNLLTGGKGGTGSAAEGLASKAGGGLGKGLSGIGKGIAGIGKGVGEAATKMLKGLAKGLSALGKPAVLLGVLALVGIASALWITGKALKDFTTISWESLAKAGIALVGLTASLMLLGAVMGTGVGAIALILGAAAMVIMAGALWVLGQAIQGIGTGFQMLSDGLDSLKDIDGMQILNITAALIGLGTGIALASPFLIAGSVGVLALGAASMLAGPGIMLLANGLSTISNTLGAFKGLDTLKSIVETINSIDIVKALAFGALGMLSAVSLPTPTTTSGVAAPSTPKSSTLDSPSAISADSAVNGNQATSKEGTSSSGTGIEKPAPESSINTALGYQSSILEQLLQGTNDLISVNKDILKYARVSA